MTLARRSLYPLLFCVVLAGLTDCAAVKIRPAKAPTDEGLHFYRPLPCLLVTETQASESSPKLLDFKIVYLPDHRASKEFVITTSSGFGSVEFTPTLTDGWNLTGLSTKVDSKTNELLTAIGGLLPKSSARTTGDKATASEIKLGLYPIVYCDDLEKRNEADRCLPRVDFEHPIFTVEGLGVTRPEAKK